MFNINVDFVANNLITRIVNSSDKQNGFSLFGDGVAGVVVIVCRI